MHQMTEEFCALMSMHEQTLPSLIQLLITVLLGWCNALKVLGFTVRPGATLTCIGGHIVYLQAVHDYVSLHRS